MSYCFILCRSGYAGINNIRSDIIRKGVDPINLNYFFLSPDAPLTSQDIPANNVEVYIEQDLPASTPYVNTYKRLGYAVFELDRNGAVITNTATKKVESIEPAKVEIQAKVETPVVDTPTETPKKK